MSGLQGARVPASRVLLVAAFGAFLAFLDATIVNVAFPSIRESFPGTSIGGLSWVLNAYNIVFAAFLIVFGRLTDLVGRRRVFVAGVVVFTGASALCGLAPSVDLLVAARVLQALGAAMLVPASLALVVAAFPEDRRAHAIGLWGATAAVAAGLGPPLGGALVELGGWRWAFWVNIPFGVVAAWVARRQLVESRAPGVRSMPDLRGAALLAGGLGVLNLGIVKGSDWGWSSLVIVGSFVAAAVLIALFALSSRVHRSPLIDPALLRIPSFTIASTATIVGGLGFYAYLLTNILWLQYVWDYSVLRAGLALVPGALVAAVVAARLGPLADRYGYRPFVVPGALVWAAAYLWYHQQVGLTPAFWSEWLPGQVLSGIGVGATLPLLGSAALAAVPGGRYATASAVMSSARQLGGVLGIAILVVILGEPTPATAVAAFRDGWVLSICAFLGVAVLSVPLGRLQPVSEDDALDDFRPARVHAPLASLPAVALRTALPADLTDLSGVPLLGALPGDARHRLEASSRLVHVPAGDLLLRAGDPPGSAYVVRRGRLAVEVGGQFTRELGPGDVLGELALLTGQGRSADVRARRDSTVLEVPREAFEEMVDHDAAAARVVLTQVADRLRTAGGPQASERPLQPAVVAVVGLHRGAHAVAVAEEIARRLALHHRTVRLDTVDAHGLDRAEQEHDRVVLVAASADGAPARAWQEFCLRQADAVVLVSGAGEDPPREPITPTPGRQPDVVLVGPDPGPERRAAWVAATDAWQLTQVDGDLRAGLRPVADRLAGRSLGLALAGGGARAFAHIGVLRELADAGLHVDRLTGSSVGAIIAALHAAGYGGEDLEELCYAEFVRRRPFSDWRLPSHSLAKGHRMADGLRRALGDAVFEGLPRQLHTVSTDLVTRSRQVHRRGILTEAVNASARLPVLFAPIPDDGGRLLVDGGVLDNLPVDLLTERDEGPVVAVNIAMGGGGGGGGRSRSGRPRVPALGETLLRTMMIGSGGAVAAAQAAGAWVVTPPTLGVGLLEFHQFDRMVAAGRAAARALLEEAGGDLYGRLGAAVPVQRAGSNGVAPSPGVATSAAPAYVEQHALLRDEHL
jgi:EmrB/QacA subfamily drug resistance transporter